MHSVSECDPVSTAFVAWLSAVAGRQAVEARPDLTEQGFEAALGDCESRRLRAKRELASSQAGSVADLAAKFSVLAHVVRHVLDAGNGAAPGYPDERSVPGLLAGIEADFARLASGRPAP